MADRVGQHLGHYRLTRLLGRGGFAEVYLGEHIDLGTQAAIKILHTRVVEEDMVPFRQEARLLASLRHPYIVRVLDFGVSEETPYLVMDYAPHGTLRTRHARGTLLPVPAVVNYVKQIAQALQYAHDRKIVHRDIKPENMLIGEQNEILLSDFGIALIAQSSHYQSRKDMAGTIAYMAPEQIGEHPRPQSDQYSLGVVVYEWFSGTLPFHGTLAEIAIKHSVTPPPPLRDRLATFSPDLEQVLFTALAKRPEERFASVSAFATALEQASQEMLPIKRLHHGSTSTPPTPLDAILLPPLTATEFASPPNQPAEPSVTTTAQNDQSMPIPTTEPPPDLPTPGKVTDKARVSRRTVLVGAGIATTIGVGTGVFAILRVSSQSRLPVAPRGQPATPQHQLFVYKGHSDVVKGVIWSRNANRIVSSSYDNTVQVWDASDGSNVFTYKGHSSGVQTVAQSPDGKRIASGSFDKTVQVWDASDGSNVFIYKGHSDGVWSVAWSPDGKRIASGAIDNTVQVWDASDGSNVFIYKGHSDWVEAVAWSPDGKHIASGSRDNTMQVWNASDGSNVFPDKNLSSLVDAVAWSPDGQRIASATGQVGVWNASDGSTVFIYQGHSEGVHGVAWSPDGQRIASGSLEVQVWNASDGRNVFIYQGHSAYVNAIAWSPDGKRIASGSDDNTVQVWKPA